MHLGVFGRQRRQKRAGEEEQKVNEAELTALREVVVGTMGGDRGGTSAALQRGPTGV